MGRGREAWLQTYSGRGSWWWYDCRVPPGVEGERRPPLPGAETKARPPVPFPLGAAGGGSTHLAVGVGARDATADHAPPSILDWCEAGGTTPAAYPRVGWGEARLPSPLSGGDEGRGTANRAWLGARAGDGRRASHRSFPRLEPRPGCTTPIPLAVGARRTSTPTYSHSGSVGRWQATTGFRAGTTPWTGPRTTGCHIRLGRQERQGLGLGARVFVLPGGVEGR